jgi:hypothetical protein
MPPAVTSLRQTHIDRLQVLLRHPPALPVVALECAQACLDRHLFAWNLSAGLIYLATPFPGVAGNYRYQSLAELLVQRLAQARPTLLVEGYHVVMRRVREVYAPGAPSLAELEPLINQCGAQLLDAFGLRLQAWWREPVSGFTSRWAALSDGLLALLYDAPAPPGMDQADVTRWFPKSLLQARRPTPYWSLHGPVRVHSVHLRRANQLASMAPLLVLTHVADDGSEHQVLFRPASGIHLLQGMEEIGPWLEACDPTLDQWFVQEAQADPFDTLAASYLACQLREMDAIDRTRVRTPLQIMEMLDFITDPGRWFVDRLSPLQQQLHRALPLWLTHADARDSQAYASLLQQWVRVRDQQGAVHFMEGIAPLREFAAERLRACLAREPLARAMAPEDIHVTFDRVIAAAVPVPGGFIAGEVETVTVTLVELALENLAGFPHTARSIKVKDASAPGWLTYERLKACVQEADIGATYPALLRQKLIDDATESSRRRQLFREQWRIQLPMLALTLKIQGREGLSQTGFECLRAAVQATPTERRQMALWPLAFQAGAGATPDIVPGFFIIGPQVRNDGPHLLYQPLFEPALQEYSSLDALFEAIKTSGPLQDSVLTWIAPARQAIYAHGGFREPHIRHFLPTDEFTVYEKPAPAQLDKTLIDGDPADAVFTALVRSMVALADRQTVSNTEQRWARLKQAGWLLLGTLLPYLRGPLMLGGWLLQVVDSVQQDVDGLAREEGQTRSAALLDLLVNLMAVLAHQAAPQDPRHPLPLEHPTFAPLAKATSRLRVPVRIPTPQGFTVPAGWANARDVLTPLLQARINALSLMTYSKPWPTALENAERSGPWQGLRRVTGTTAPQWQVLVRGQQFRVLLDQERARVVSADGHTLGPWLKHQGRGHWDFDLQLRLRGGADRPLSGPSQAPGEVSRQAEYAQAVAQRERASRVMEAMRRLTQVPSESLDAQRRQRAQDNYVQAMRDKLTHAVEEQQALKRLRAIKPRPRYEEDLCDVLETIILTTQLLDTQMRAQMTTINARIRPLLDSLSHESAEEADADINRQAHAQLRQGMRELATVHEQAIRWRVLEERYLKELTEVPRFGRDRSRALTTGLHARPSVLDLQALQLTTLWGIAIDVDGPPLDDDFFADMGETINRARWASRSLADLDQMQATTAERMELLESLDHIYTQTDDQLEFWRAMEPDKFDLDYLQKLQELLAALHQQVERHLGELLEPEPMPGASTWVRDSGQPRKKIIRTRNRDLFVARMSPPTERQQVEIAEVGGTDGSPVGSFTQAEDGVWDLARVSPRRPDPELGKLMSKAQYLLGEVDKAITHVERMEHRANAPASLQDLLEAQARSRQWLADDIHRKLSSLESARLAAVQQANARALESQLRAAATRLQAAGLQARVRATRSRPMNQDDVAFLHEQCEVRVVRQGRRVALRGRGNDYLQVYAVVDRRTDKPLCFAHFHYERSQGPDDHFTAAHLKTLEQERLGRQAQSEFEAQAFTRMRLGQTGRVQQTLEIHRAQISLSQARRLFFSVD